jgi:hypothetical protein
MRRSRLLITLTAAAAGLLLVSPTSASAEAEVSDPIATGLVGPLQIDVGHKGQIYVGQAFAGLLTKVRPNGTTTNLVTEPIEVSGVASRGFDVAYLVDGGEGVTKAALKVRNANGKVRTVANLMRYEVKNNPDEFQRYGFRNLDADCADQVPAEVGGGYPYGGIVDSHPYALANAPGGGWYVADAGANAIYHVSKKGKIEVVNVPRPQKAVISAEAAEANGLPECTVGATYAFEPVPTDVEVNKLGYVIFSLLPGGPEDPSLGARGAVYRVSPGDYEWSRLGGGFAGAANVATAPGGRIYVSELFGNRVSLLRDHKVTPVADVPSPSGLEFKNGRLYASTDVFGAGNIVTITP